MNLKKMKKISAFAILALLALADFAGHAVAAQSTGAKKLLNRPLKLGHYSSACESYFFAAEMLGLYEKNGLEVEFIRVDNNIAKEGIVSGKLDVTDGVLQSWLKPIEQGLDVKFTLGLHQGCMSSTVLTDSPYKSITDLKGKTIGVSAPIGSGAMNYLYRTILHAGLDPVKDYEWVAYDMAALPNALDTGKVDAIVGPDSILYGKVKNGEHRFLTVMATDKYLDDELCCLLAFSPVFIKEHPEVAKVITRILYEAAEYTDAHKEEVVRYEHAKGYINGTLEDNLAVVAPYRFKPSVAVGLRSFENSFRDYQATGIIEKGVDLKKVVDRAFIIYDDIDKK
jgi:NitT/TauT family transport system substrate-binding protein